MLGHFVPLLLATRHTTPAFLPRLTYHAMRMGPFTLWRAARDLFALDGAGHVPKFYRPEEFNAGHLSFLAGEPVGE